MEYTAAESKELVGILAGRTRTKMSKKLYMVIENFRQGDAIAVYQRFRDRGRLAPDGLHYVSSWVTDDCCRCYQLMETEDPELLKQWMANWSDIVDFEVFPVITSEQARKRMAPYLGR